MKHQGNKQGKTPADKSLEKSLDKSTIKSLRQQGDGDPNDRSQASPQARAGDNQGEGNRDAARRYNEDQQRFVQSGKAEAAARDAAPASEKEAASLARAEREGRRHAKEEDPTVPGANAQRPGRDSLGNGD